MNNLLKENTKKLITYIEEESSEFSTLTSVLTRKNEKDLLIQLKYSQKYLKESNNVVYSENYILSKDSSKLVKLNFPSTSCSDAYIFESQCPRNDSLIIRGKKVEKKHFLEIWKDDHLNFTFETTNFFEHIYLEDIFGYIEWNSANNKVVFMAERKVKEEIKFQNLLQDFEKNVDFYLQQNDKLKDFSRPPDHRYDPVMFVYDLDANQLFEVLNTVREEFYPLSPIFSGEGIIFVGLYKQNFQFANVYVYNRKKSLFWLEKLKLKKCQNNDKNEISNKNEELDKKEEKTEILNQKKDIIENDAYEPFNITPDIWTSFDQIFSNDFGKLYFTGRETQFVEHNTCYQVFELDFENYLKTKQINYKIIIDVKRENSEGFNGLYKVVSFFGSFSRISIFKNYILLNTCEKGKDKIYFYDTLTKELFLPSFHEKNYSYTVVHITEEHIFISKNGDDLYNSLSLFNNNDSPLINFSQKMFDDIQKPILKEFINSYLKSETALIKLENGAEALLYLSDESKKEKCPLIVFIHGGPHGYSLMLKNYSKFNSMFLNQGYNVIVLNYRGSTSYGLNFVESLINNCGKTDVEDCINLIEEAIQLFPEEIDRENIGIYGGSHGGFLTGWLVTHPTFNKNVKCAVLCNAVLYAPAIISGSSIPDWAFACLNSDTKNIEWPISKQNLIKMYESTPVLNVENTKAACLIINGEKDTTVCEQNGRYFYNCLKKYRSDCAFVNYPLDYHQIKNPESSLHFLITIYNWFTKHFKKI